MKKTSLLFSLLTLLAAGLALVPGGVARADEKARSGVWVFDVRVVRVDPTTPEVAETQSVFEEAEGTTVPMGWPQILATLKKRGKTTLLMDQRTTTMDGVKGMAVNIVEHPMLMVATSDINNTQKRQGTLRTGCSFEVTPTAAQMTYNVEARWALTRSEVKETEAPPQLMTRWQGTHPPLAGDTLVLHYREQIDTVDGSSKAVELYALICGRFIAR